MPPRSAWRGTSDQTAETPHQCGGPANLKGDVRGVSERAGGATMREPGMQKSAAAARTCKKYRRATLAIEHGVSSSLVRDRTSTEASGASRHTSAKPGNIPSSRTS